METVDLDLDDIFDHQDDEQFEEGLAGQTATLPELDDGEQPMAEQDEDGEGGEEQGAQLNRLRDLSKGAAKRRVQRPQPKLDADRLRSERGLAVLPKLLGNVKFKGKGHEAADLQLMMGKLEHWAHRLFPQMPFDSFIGRLEKLGKKKTVQNCVTRIRLDMPILDSDYVTQYEDANDQEAQQQPTNEPVEEVTEMDAEEAFEEMLRQERELQKQRKDDAEEDPFAEEIASQMSEHTEVAPAPSQASVHVPPVATSKAVVSISEEQKAEIERKRRLAMEKRAARLGIPVSELVTPKKPTTSKNGASQAEPAVRDGGMGMNQEHDCSSAQSPDAAEHASETCILDRTGPHGDLDQTPTGQGSCSETNNVQASTERNTSRLDSANSDQMNGVDKRTSQSSLQSPLTDQEGPTLLDRLPSHQMQEDCVSDNDMISPAASENLHKKDLSNMDKLNHNFSDEEETMGALQIDLDSESVPLL